MMELRHADCDDPDFLALVRLLDADLAEKDGDEHAFYAQFNKPVGLDVLVGYADGIAVSCGALRKLTEQTAEIKRMFTLPDYRGRGLATQMLVALEAMARQGGFSECVLETGNKQVDAIGLYHKNGYEVISNYGPYVGVENSVCFRKTL